MTRKPAKKVAAKRKPAKKVAAKKGSARSTLRPGGSSTSALTTPLESPRFVPPPSWNAAGSSTVVPPFPPEPIKRPEPTAKVRPTTLSTRPLRPSIQGKTSGPTSSFETTLAPIPSPVTPADESGILQPARTESRADRRRRKNNFKSFLVRMGERSIPVGAFVVAVAAAMILLLIVLTTGGGAGGLLADSDSKPAVSASEIKAIGQQMVKCDETLSVLQGLAKRSPTAGGTLSAEELLAVDSSLESTCGQLRSRINRLVVASK